MLQLDDQALARIAIAATAVAPDARAAWLAQLACKLAPPRPRRRASTRQARWRERQRNGQADHFTAKGAAPVAGRQGRCAPQ